MAHFYREHGRVLLSGDIIGCAMSGTNNHTLSVIAAYWPGSGSSLHSIDYTEKRIGVVQYFVLHSIEFYKENDDISAGTEKFQCLFCFLHWKKQHPKANWFGVSAVVCDDCFRVTRCMQLCTYTKNIQQMCFC